MTRKFSGTNIWPSPGHRRILRRIASSESNRKLCFRELTGFGDLTNSGNIGSFPSGKSVPADGRKDILLSSTHDHRIPFMTVLADPWALSDLSRTASVTIAVLTGSIFNLTLYGVLTVQTYLYYICFPNDHIILKTSIYAIYAAETAYTALLTYDLICLMLDPLRTAAFTSFMIPICGGIVAILTQTVYAYRIRAMTRKITIPLGIIVVIIAGFILNLILIKLKASFYLVSLASSVSCLVVDVTVSTIMIWNLTRTKIHSRLLQQRVTRLIHLFIGGGVLTVAVNIVTLIASLLSMKLAISSGILQSKIYANSMMVLLNNRAAIGHVQTDMEVYLSESSELGTFRVAPVTTATHEAQGTSSTTDFTAERLDRKEYIMPLSDS